MFHLIKLRKLTALIVLTASLQFLNASSSYAGGPPRSPNASCAALVTNVAKINGSNLGLVFQLIKNYGWSIQLWPDIARSAIKDGTGCD